jgi:photosystem II stability/assembly factor-like uncharacterized protein
MEAVESETESDFGSPHARVRRALALMVASIVTITLTGALYLHPEVPAFGRSATTTMSALQSTYRVTAVDFVNPSDGWVAVDFPSGDFGVLHTSDGGLSWTRQLAGAADGHPAFMKFFDEASGVFALVGTAPLFHRTADGGRTWVSVPARKVTGTVVSWSFVDSYQGWMLVRGSGQAQPISTTLYHTGDAGVSWVDLGHPVAAPDQAFQVSFSYFTTGWLSSASSGPYAYKSGDFGATWARVALPAPEGGWPRGGQFLVAVQPTSGGGAVASVVYFPPIKGRTGIGADIRSFPPLVVRSFDGGRPHTYTYTTVIDQVAGGPYATEQPPNQAQLGTVDNGSSWSAVDPPATSGAIGYFDALNWWWIGAGRWASSGDGGSTWTNPRGIGVIEPLPGSLQVLDRDHAWFAASSGSRPVLQATDDGGLHWRMVLLPPMPDLPTL